MTDSENPNRSGPQPEEDTLGSFYMGRMRPPPEPKRVLPRGLLSVLTVVAFAIILWYAYSRGPAKYSGVDVPVISADSTQYKFKPEDPGGMEVRHQDSTVFDPLSSKDSDAVEHLRPTPEQPMDKAEATAKDAAAALEADKPEMNLDVKMEKLPSGSEKIVSAEDAAKPKDIDGKDDIKEADIKDDKAAGETKIKEDKIAEARIPDTKIAEAKIEDDKIETTVTEDKPTASAPTVAKIEAKPAETAKPPETSKPAEKAVTASSAAPKGIFIQLGSYRDAAGAESDWAKLQKKFAAQLSGLGHQLQRVDLGAKGTWNRLYAGPVTDARAKEICAALKSQNTGGCIISRK